MPNGMASDKTAPSTPDIKAFHVQPTEIRATLWTLLICILILVGREASWSFPVPFLLLYATIIFTALSKGTVAGVLSGLLGTSFIIYSAAINFGPPTLTGGVVPIIFGAVLFIGSAYLIGRLRQSQLRLRNQLTSLVAEKTTSLQKKNEEMSAALASLKAAESRNRIYNQRIKTIIENSASLLFEIDETRTVTWLQGMSQFPQSEMKQLKTGDRVVDILPDFDANLQMLLKSVWQGQSRNLILNECGRIFNIRLLPSSEKGEQHKKALGIAVDITDRIEAERLRLEVERERELLELKHRFITTASHNFRTPLTVLNSDTDLLITYGEKINPARQMRILERMQKQITDLNHMLENLLTINSASSERIVPRPSALRLRSLCDRVAETQAQLLKNRNFTYQFATDLEVIESDSKLVEDALSKVFQNALVYTASDDTINFRVSSSDGYVALEVTNSGPSIPESDLAHIFEPFHRGSDVINLEGMGIGLTLAKLFVDALGGYIRVKNLPEQGVATKISLPISEKAKPKMLY